MLSEILSQLAQGKCKEAQAMLADVEVSEGYESHIRTWISAFIHASCDDSTTAFQEAAVVASFFSSHPPTVFHLREANGWILSGLEATLVDLLWVIVLSGQERWKEAKDYVDSSLRRFQQFQEWSSRYGKPQAHHPFTFVLPIHLSGNALRVATNRGDASDAIRIRNELLSTVRQLRRQASTLPPLYEEALQTTIHQYYPQWHRDDRFVSNKEALYQLVRLEDERTEHTLFQPNNNLSTKEPFISVCVSAYKEGEWFKMTIDSILEHAEYEPFEIVVVLQKAGEADRTGAFLFTPPYQQHPKIRVFEYATPLGCEGGKDTAFRHAAGEIVCALDSHVIPCRGFLRTIADTLVRHPEVNAMVFGLTYANACGNLGETYFDEIPYELNGVVGHKVITDSTTLQPYKENLSIRHSFMGAAYVVTKKAYYESHGCTVLPHHGWGDKLLGMNLYLHGYETFTHPGVTAIHRWQEETTDFWRDSFRRTKDFEYRIEVVANALKVGFCYLPSRYFETSFVPWVRGLSGPNFELQYGIFDSARDALCAYREAFWKTARRTIHDYWTQYGDFIWERLTDAERRCLTRDLPPG